VLAGSVHTLVARAGIAVIQWTYRRVLTESGAGIALVKSARVGVIAIFLNMQARTVHAVIIRAEFLVIQIANLREFTLACLRSAGLAKVIGTGVSVIANFRCAHALPVHALVIGAGIVVGTVARNKIAGSIHARIRSAGIVVIANDLLVDTFPGDLAEIFSTRIVVVAGKTIRASALAIINGAGVAIRACERNMECVGTTPEISCDDMIISQGNIRPNK